MADNQKPRVEQKWIEQELEQSLRRVAAPDALWDRLQRPEPARSRVQARFMALATVPVVMLVALLGLHTRSGPAVQFRSSDPVEVQAWVKSKTGLDVPMHGAKLAGASLVPGGVSGAAVEITYRGDGAMKLMVSAGRAATGKIPAGLQWTAGGLNYQLACADQQDLKACALCHVGG
jgi:hypothetical protein